MSLVAWYKLDGDANDSSGFGNHGAIRPTEDEWVNGKIGLCLRREGTTNLPTTLYSSINLIGQFSYGGWFKIPSSNDSSYTQRLVGEGDYRRCLGCTESKLRYGNHASSVTNVNISSYQNEWHHYFVTSNEGTYRLYINGNFIQQVTGHRTEINITDIGRMSYNCEMNDIRIYDHALTEKEIKELAKAKILHYTFDYYSVKTDNLVVLISELRNLNINETWTDSPLMYTKLGEHRYKVEWLTDHTYTKRTITDNIIDHTQDTIGSCYILDYYEAPGTEARIGLGRTGYGNPWLNGYHSLGHKTYFTAGEENRNFTWSIRTGMDSLIKAGSYLIWDKFQVERKTYATPFVEGTREAICLDKSGYDKHAIVPSANLPTYQIDEKKVGVGCYEFDSSGNTFIQTNVSPNNVESISLWYKNKSDPRNQLMIMAHNPTNSRLYIGWPNVNNTTLTGGVGNKAWFPDSGDIYDIDVWHHVVLTYDKTDAKLYHDGVLKAIGDATWISSVGFLRIGQHTNGGHKYNGYIDDVRFYSTVLSDEEVMEIYQQKMSLDRNGNLFVPDINSINVSDSSLMTFKDGTLHHKRINENGVSDGLVGRWKLNGTANDFSGNNNHGTPADVEWVGSERGQVAEFNNITTNAINLGPSNQLVSYTFTLSAWFYAYGISTTNSGHRIITLQRANGSSAVALATGWSNTGAGYVIRHENNGHGEQSIPVDINTWYFISITFDGIDTKFYLNNNLTFQRSDGFEGASSHDAFIGNFTGSSLPFDGLISDVRIYNRALSQQEINFLYESEVSNKIMSIGQDSICVKGNILDVIPKYNNLNEGLIGDWGLDGNANDKSGSGINGTLHDGGWTNDPQRGTVVDLDGTSWIDLGDSLYLPNNHPFTATGWMKVNTFSSKDMLICRNNAVKNASPYTWLLGSISGASISAYTGSAWVNSSYVFQSATWYFLGFSFNGTNMSFYVNGDLTDSLVYSFSDDTTGRNTQIGGYNGNTGNVIGNKSDVRFYNRALSTTEIKILYMLQSGSLR